jgi:transcriptional regulator with XRE-family HTH domain
MTREKAQALVKKHGSIRKAAKVAGINRRTLGRWLSGETRPRPVTPATVSHLGQGGARSINDFRNTYDLNTIVPKKIAVGFKQLGAGWLYESEFAKSAGLTMKDLGMFRDNYADHIVVVGDSRRIWVGRKQTAEEMRKMI